MELLEREDALHALGDHMAAATAGRGGLVFLSGEAGVGKSVLLQRFCEAQGDGARVLMGSCDVLPSLACWLTPHAPEWGRALAEDELLGDHEAVALV